MVIRAIRRPYEITDAYWGSREGARCHVPHWTLIEVHDPIRNHVLQILQCGSTINASLEASDQIRLTYTGSVLLFPLTTGARSCLVVRYYRRHH